MARTGRPPKPTFLKIVEGNPGRRPLNLREPLPAKSAAGARRCPASLPPAGKRLWKSLVPELERMNLLTKIDDAALEGACVNYARAIEARSILKKQGLTIMTEKGFVLAHPAVAIERGSWQQCLRFMSEFGLTPSARSRIHIAPAGTPADPAEAFLFPGGAGGVKSA